MTKQDYIRIARAVSEARAEARDNGTREAARQRGIDQVVLELVRELRADNGRFDSARFVSACNIGRAS